jgi:hypothetical protein
VLEVELASEKAAVITYQPEGSEHSTPILACITSTASLSIRRMVKAERLDKTRYRYTVQQSSAKEKKLYVQTV